MDQHLGDLGSTKEVELQGLIKVLEDLLWQVDLVRLVQLVVLHLGKQYQGALVDKGVVQVDLLLLLLLVVVVELELGLEDPQEDLACWVGLLLEDLKGTGKKETKEVGIHVMDQVGMDSLLEGVMVETTFQGISVKKVLLVEGIILTALSGKEASLEKE